MALASSASAQSPGTSTYWLHEQQRRQAIADQIGTQEHLRWQSGLPSRLSPARPYSLESIYSGLAYAPGPDAPWRTDVFEPWPFVPGDIYGRQFDGAVPQPWGHRVTPLGPNGYTYEPLYEPLLPLPAPAVPAIPPERPLPRAAPGRPPIEELPPPQASPELREF
jgi:hypothetical protein